MNVIGRTAQNHRKKIDLHKQPEHGTAKFHGSSYRGNTTCCSDKQCSHKESRWGAMEAEGVCQLVLPAVYKCVPFEEGILGLQKGGLVAHPLGLG